MADINAWLESLGLNKYREVFASNDIDLTVAPVSVEAEICIERYRAVSARLEPLPMRALRIIFGLAVLAALVFGSADLWAQSTARVPRVGMLFIGSPAPNDPAANGFITGLRDLGYVDGRNVVLEARYAGGRPDRLAPLAAELVRLKVDVLVAGGPGPLEALRKATDAIPIVAVSGSDPVAEGWAKSLARPGGNTTGLTVTFPELESKRIEFLKQALPRLTRLAVVLDPDEIDLASFANLIRAPARRLGIELQFLEVRRQDDFERAFRLVREGGAQAIFTVETTFVVENRSLIAEFAARERLPLAGEFTAFGSEGLLMAYGADLGDLLRRAATHVDRVLKGARPGELPIEQPTKFRLLINLRTAKALGVTIPQSLLLLADDVIQ